MGPTVSTEKENVAVPVSQSGQKKLQQLYPNYIRTFAAFAVVQMHAVGGYLFELNPDTGMSDNWMTANVYYSFLRWASPFFIMLSGSLMLNPARMESTREFLKRRLNRILYPFAFWSVVYLLYQYRDKIWFWESPDWGEFWNLVLFNDIYFHLWFIPMIAGMYLLTPVFRLWIRHASRSDLEYFLVLAFTFTVLQHFWPSLIFIKYIGWLGYIGYYVLGYYLITYPVQRRNLIYIAALCMPPLTAYVTWWLSSQSMQYENRFFVYFSPNVVLMTFAFFLFLRNYPWDAFAVRFPSTHRFVIWFYKLSFGVYFIHALILDMFKNGYFGLYLFSDNIFGLHVSPWYGTFIQSIIVTLLSALAMAGLDKIPGLKKWVM